MADPRCDVVVVGAGVSGLAAADRLAAAGLEVAVVEARDRVGGRIDTRRPEPAGVVELGAQVLHGTDNLLLQRCDLTGPVRQVARDTVTRAVVLTGERSHAFDAATEQFTSPTVLAHRLRVTAAATARLGLPDLTLGAALTSMPLSPDSRSALLCWYGNVTGGDAAGLPLSEICSGRVFQYHGTREAVVPAGLDVLPARLAAGLDVRLGQPVQRIAVDAAGPVTVTASGRSLHASYCVLTVPPPLVHTGRVVVEGLPDQWLEAAGRLRLGDAVVAVATLDEPAQEAAFALDVAGGAGFVSVQTGARHAVAVAKGAAAGGLRRLVADPAAFRSRIARALPGCRIAAQPPLVHDWGRDPWATGAFTAPTVHTVRASQIWARPWLGRLFPAGEGAASATGAPFLDAAYRSGLAAADAVLAQARGRGAA